MIAACVALTRRLARPGCQTDSAGIHAHGNVDRPASGCEINGRQRHIAADTIRLLLTVLVTPAGVQDRDGAWPLLWNLRRAFPSARLAWAGGGYAGELVTWARTGLKPGLTLGIVKRPDDLHTFQVLPPLGRRADPVPGSPAAGAPSGTTNG